MKGFYFPSHNILGGNVAFKIVNFDWMSFNFEDVTHDYFPIFPLKALKTEPRSAGQRFFIVCLFSPVTHQGSTCSL